MRQTNWQKGFAEGIWCAIKVVRSNEGLGSHLEVDIRRNCGCASELAALEADDAAAVSGGATGEPTKGETR